MSTGLMLTLDEYDRMVQCGAFDHLNRRIELIRGEIRQSSPAGPLHDDLIAYLYEWSLESTSRGEVSIRGQSGLDIPNLNSRPEPDLVWVRAGRYFKRHPSAADVRLAIEVAHSSLAYDMSAKARLYAEAGIAEYWIVDANASCVHVFREPQGSGYALQSIVSRGETIAPLAARNATLNVSELFGEES